VSDTSQGEGWWLAADGKWHGPKLRPVNLGAPSPLVPASGEFAQPTGPSASGDGSRKKRWLLLIPGFFVCIVVVVIVSSVLSTHTKSYHDGYHYGSVVAPRLDNSDTLEACGGSQEFPPTGISSTPGDDVAQWQAGCVAGWDYVQSYAASHNGAAPPTGQQAFSDGYSHGMSGMISGASVQSVCPTYAPSQYQSAGLGAEWHDGCAIGYTNGSAENVQPSTGHVQPYSGGSSCGRTGELCGVP